MKKCSNSLWISYLTSYFQFQLCSDHFLNSRVRMNDCNDRQLCGHVFVLINKLVLILGGQWLWHLKKDRSLSWRWQSSFIGSNLDGQN